MINYDLHPELPKFCVPYISKTYLSIAEPGFITAIAKHNLQKQIEYYKRLLPEHAQLVLDGSHDGFSTTEMRLLFDKFRQTVVNYTGQVNVLTCEPNHHDDIFFPSWLYRCNTRYQGQPLPTISKRQHRVSSLNRQPVTHRIYLYYLLSQRAYFNDMLFSFGGLLDNYNNETIELNNDRLEDLPVEVFEWVKTKPPMIPIENDVDTSNVAGNPGDHSWLHPAFTDSYLNIVTETHWGSVFFSEKTFKPLVAGQLFMMAGGYKQTRFLKQLGFETFDDVFDDHLYEWFVQIAPRMEGLVRTLDILYDNIEEIYFSKTRELAYNQEYAVSDSFRQRLTRELRDRGLVDD